MTAIRIPHFCFWIVVVSGALSCASPKVDLGRRPSGVQPSDYSARFREWSREIRVLPMDGLENILTARATYLSFNFREAYIERVSYDLNLSPADKHQLQTSEMENLDKGHEFFVTLMSAVGDCDNLDPDKGPWTIRLKNDQEKEAAPISVEEIDKVKPNHVKYFFFNPSFRKAYRLIFPFSAQDGSPLISPQTRFFELSFATAYGRSSARWQIADK